MSKTVVNSANNYIDKYNQEKLEECLKMIQFCENETINLKKKLKRLESIKKECEKEVYSLCNHEWIIDRSFQDEHTAYICTHCNSYM
jgi:hypothetical protein